MHANDQAQTHEGMKSVRSAARTPGRGVGVPGGLAALHSSAGNAAVVQMLRQAGHAWAQDQHQHGAGCGHQQTEQASHPAVQRSTVHDVLRTTGRPLDDATRTDMESRLGADFSDVRIHNDSAAKASAAEVGARAYTSGSHVVIGDGGADKHTLAHELTHVIQQRQGPVAGTDNGSGLKVSDPSDRYEREAEANAHRVMAGAPSLQRSQSGGDRSGTRDVENAHSAPGTEVQRAKETKGAKAAGKKTAQGSSRDQVDGPKQGDHLFNGLGDTVLKVIDDIAALDDGSPAALAAGGQSDAITALANLAQNAKVQRANHAFESAMAVKGGGSGRAGDTNSRSYGTFAGSMRTAVAELEYLYGWPDSPGAAAVLAVTTKQQLLDIIFDKDAHDRKEKENGVNKSAFKAWVTQTGNVMWELYVAYTDVLRAIHARSLEISNGQ
ncbi:eCIS core domain-containing protein [Streptomyces hundungensis]|uniref:eCIS core domain-containing protein n=1 Tax=Streptomyces hundungensis TaxID=1077946 RepID=UPI003F53F81D